MNACGPIHRLRRLAVLGVFASVMPMPLIGQWWPGHGLQPGDCVPPSRDYLGCALAAGGIRPLDNQHLRHGFREIRYWSVAGNMQPERLTIIREYPDSTVGDHYHLWRVTLEGDSVLHSMCWGPVLANAVGGFCRASLPRTVDWKSLTRALDSLGLPELPARPVPPNPCYRLTRPDGWPTCPTTGDGFIQTIEYRTEGTYWRYERLRLPDEGSPLHRRDTKIFQLLHCLSVSPNAPVCAEAPH